MYAVGYYREQWKLTTTTCNNVNESHNVVQKKCSAICLYDQGQKHNFLEQKSHKGKNIVISCARLMNSYWVTLIILFRDVHVCIKIQRQATDLIFMYHESQDTVTSRGEGRYWLGRSKWGGVFWSAGNFLTCMVITGVLILIYSLNCTFYIIFHNEIANTTGFWFIWFHFYVLILEHRWGRCIWGLWLDRMVIVLIETVVNAIDIGDCRVVYLPQNTLVVA